MSSGLPQPPAPKGRKRKAWGVSPRKGKTLNPQSPKGRQQTLAAGLRDELIKLCKKQRIVVDEK
jgi:hypothetical protein